MLKSIAPGRIGFAAVSSAYNQALEFKRTAVNRLRERFKALAGETEGYLRGAAGKALHGPLTSP